MLAPSRASRLGTRRARSVCIGGTASIVLHAHLAADRGQRLDETGGAAGAAASAFAGPVSPRPPGKPVGGSHSSIHSDHTIVSATNGARGRPPAEHAAQLLAARRGWRWSAPSSFALVVRQRPVRRRLVDLLVLVAAVVLLTREQQTIGGAVGHPAPQQRPGQRQPLRPGRARLGPYDDKTEKERENQAEDGGQPPTAAHHHREALPGRPHPQHEERQHRRDVDAVVHIPRQLEHVGKTKGTANPITSPAPSQRDVHVPYRTVSFPTAQVDRSCFKPSTPRGHHG